MNFLKQNIEVMRKILKSININQERSDFKLKFSTDHSPTTLRVGICYNEIINIQCPTLVSRLPNSEKKSTAANMIRWLHIYVENARMKGNY